MPAGKGQHVGKGFAVLCLIVHGALYVAVDAYHSLIWRHYDYVALLQVYVLAVLAVEKEVVYVCHGEPATVAHHLYVSHRAYVGDASRAVEGVEYSRERREAVGAGGDYLAHDVHLYRAHFAEIEAYFGG